MSQKSIHWFRKGLRLHDNPALLAACQDATELYPVFFLDPFFAKSSNYRVGVNRWRFLLQSLEDLDASLRKLNSRLFVVRGDPKIMMPELFKDWKITTLTFEIDTEPYAIQRDDAIEKLAKACNVNVIKRVSHTLYDTEKTISKNGGSPPLTYQRLQAVLKQMGAPPKPSNTLTSSHLSDCTTPWKEEFDEKYGVPTLAELGKNEEDCGPLLFPGGEMEALSRMERYLKKTNWICKFEKPQTEPNSLEPSTTVLSPYIKFGCLSVRTFYYRLLDIYNLSKVMYLWQKQGIRSVDTL